MLIGGRYSREGEIGRGGMGAVWLGRDEVLGRAVAIKRVGMMPGGSSPDLLRAEREARIAASLNHPHVVAIYDLVNDEDQQWLVMEYFAGTTLADIVRRDGPLTTQQLAPLLVQAAQALAAAHEAGVVHRDVKPSNILVREDGLAKISDFGIARSGADESLTQTGLVTGSPAYLAPEVASGRLATPASDVWSLGATAYHALAGKPPYDVGDNVLGALYRIVNEAPPRLPDAGEMDTLLRATMAHHPESRWTMPDVVRFLDGINGTSSDRPRVRPEPHPAPVRTPVPAPVSADVGGDGTQVLASTGAPGPSTARPSATPVAPPGESTMPRRRTPILPLLVGLLVLGLIITIGVLLRWDDSQPNAPKDGSSSTTSSTLPSTSPSQSPTKEPEKGSTKAAIESFVTSYVATASRDPSAGFELLTPEFQQASGGFGGYNGFWGDVKDTQITSVKAMPKNLTVSYTYTYTAGGAAKGPENVVLQLVREGDSFLIAGPA